MILSLTSPQTIESIDLGASTPRLSGVVDVTGFDSLVSLSVNENDIQNFIFPPNSNLEELSLNYNKLQGTVNQYMPLGVKKISLDNNLITSISNLSTYTNLEDFRCSENPMTGNVPDLSDNTALVNFVVGDNQLTGSIPDLSNNTELVYFTCRDNQLTGSIPDLSDNTELVYFDCHTNDLTGYVAGSVPVSLKTFRANSNQLTATAVNAILADFVAAGATNGTLNLGDPGNAAPTGQGLTDKQTLLSRGWSVTTN